MPDNNILLIIVCKGIKKNGKHEDCKFLHDGSWGDGELIEHEKLHTKSNPSCHWLGFDVPRSFGKFSGRDGKRE
jgi:hypothetical protein